MPWFKFRSKLKADREFDKKFKKSFFETWIFTKIKTETDHRSFSYHLQKYVISPVLKYNCIIQLNFTKLN